jgi:hypothetical protein
MDPPPAHRRTEAYRSGISAELPDQDDPPIGHELIRVRHDDGTTEELRLHDYERVYALPGVYEQIVHERLQCRSPQVFASMLGQAVDRAGWDRADVRVIDVGAGNGMSGEALVAEHLQPVLGTDIVPAARTAALRDRPDIYEAYWTLDLLDLSDEQKDALSDMRANALNCVAPVGVGTRQLPADGLLEATKLLLPDALVAYLHDPTHGLPDPITPSVWGLALGPDVHVAELERRRYLHRRTVNGAPYEVDAVVLRVRRGP